MKRRILLLTGAMLFLALFANPVFARDNPSVVYTYAVADLGQGVWGGGPLNADGSVGGNLAFSAENGQLIFHLHPTGWSEVLGGAAVDICFTVHEIKGDSGLPTSFCLSEIGVLLPVTGQPIRIPNPDVPDMEVIIRVTPAN